MGIGETMKIFVKEKTNISKSHCGFTLPEILISICVFAILSGAAIVLFRQSQTTAEINRLRTNALRDAKKTIESVQNEIRMAEAGSVDVSTDGMVAFTIPLTDGNKQIRYELEDTTLFKSVTGSDGSNERYQTATNVEDFNVDSVLEGGEPKPGEYNAHISILIQSPSPKYEDITAVQDAVVIVKSETNASESWRGTGL